MQHFLKKRKIKNKDRKVKDRIIRDIRTLFEEKEENYYTLKRVGNFWNNNYIEFESNGDRNKNLLLQEYLFIEDIMVV